MIFISASWVTGIIVEPRICGLWGPQKRKENDANHSRFRALRRRGHFPEMSKMALSVAAKQNETGVNGGEDREGCDPTCRNYGNG